jgi:hypothetical protein
MAKVCKPISAVVGDTVASALADRVEAHIRAKYCASKGGCDFASGGGKDFADERRGVPTVQRYIGFLSANNPHVDSAALQRHFLEALPGLSRDDRARKVPDLMTHDPPTRMEYYEIKPNSVKGRSEGEKALLMIETFLLSHDLHYVPGRLFKLDDSTVFFRQSLGLFEVEISIHFFAAKDGLILYEMCTEIKQRFPAIQIDPKVVEAMSRALLVLMIALIILLIPVLA